MPDILSDFWTAVRLWGVLEALFAIALVFWLSQSISLYLGLSGMVDHIIAHGETLRTRPDISIEFITGSAERILMKLYSLWSKATLVLAVFAALAAFSIWDNKDTGPEWLQAIRVSEGVVLVLSGFLMFSGSRFFGGLGALGELPGHVGSIKRRLAGLWVFGTGGTILWNLLATAREGVSLYDDANRLWDAIQRLR